MKLLSLLAAFAGASLVVAQGIPQCVLTCSTQAAAAAGCTSFADATCVCTSADFQNAAGACLAANCTAEEQSTASSLQQALCQGQSITSGTVTATIASATGSVDLSSVEAGLTGSASGASASGASASSAVMTSAMSMTGSMSMSATMSGSMSMSGSGSAAAASTSGGAGKIEIVGFKGLAGMALGVVGVLLGGAVVL